MAGLVTDRGKVRILEAFARNTHDTAIAMSTAPFYIALATSAATLNVGTTTFDTATQIATGNGYTDGGLVVNRDTTDWDTLTESSASAYGEILLKDMVWTASGGSIPASGTGAYYAIMTDTNATIGSRQVLAYLDLTEARTIGNGAQLTLQNITIRLT